jgi:acetate kinase
VWEGKIDWTDGQARYSIKNSRGVFRDVAKDGDGPRAAAVERLLQGLWRGETQAVSGPSDIDVVGHRVVHGGPQHFEPALVTTEVKAAIKSASDFAPLHNRAELEGMEIVAKLLGPVPQIAGFDTGFHRTMSLAAATYPGPYGWFEQGIRRYGFHGINHQYCAERAAQLLGKDNDLSSLRLVTCHLGNGCSLAAVRDGRSVDTTMGFTPLEGLMMGTRSGSVDPGILTYLMRQKQLSGPQLDEVLNQKSGLLGISGISGDMRQILSARQNGHERAKLGFDMYVHRVRSGIGAMIAALGGIDALVFSAGVGENSPEVRAAVCDSFAYLGLHLDPQKNEPSPLDKDGNKDKDIAADGAPVRVFVIHAQEDWMIARECWRVVKTGRIPAQRDVAPRI